MSNFVNNFFLLKKVGKAQFVKLTFLFINKVNLLKQGMRCKFNVESFVLKDV